MQTKDTQEKTMLFSRINYVLMFIGILVIGIGFLLMTGEKNDNPAIFNSQIYSFRILTLAPIVVVLGFVIEIIAIMWRKK